MELMEQVDVKRMKRELTVTTHAQQAKDDREYWLRQSPDARLSVVEDLRMEAGRLLNEYQYPARLRRVVTVTRRA